RASSGRRAGDRFATVGRHPAPRPRASAGADTGMRRPRVLLADDHRLLREAFVKLLESDCDVLGAVTDGRALLEAAAKLRPDVVVVDIAMPRLNCLYTPRH